MFYAQLQGNMTFSAQYLRAFANLYVMIDLVCKTANVGLSEKASVLCHIVRGAIVPFIVVLSSILRSIGRYPGRRLAALSVALSVALSKVVERRPIRRRFAGSRKFNASFHVVSDFVGPAVQLWPCPCTDCVGSFHSEAMASQFAVV